MQTLELEKTQLTSERPKAPLQAGVGCQGPRYSIWVARLATFASPSIPASYSIPYPTISVGMANAPTRKYKVGHCAYLNQCVYVFGGLGILAAVLSCAEKFNIDTNHWSSIETMPTASEFISTSVQGENIVITGAKIGVLLYNVEMNSYAEEIPNVEGSKIMISEEQIVFILHSKFSYRAP